MNLKETKITCPRCNSAQRFSIQKRNIENSDRFTVYVSCKKCRKEIFLYESNKEIEEVKKVLRKVKNENRMRPTQSGLNLLAKLKKKLYNLERSLSEE